jgi:hypothetical protein
MREMSRVGVGSAGNAETRPRCGVGNRAVTAPCSDGPPETEGPAQKLQ